MNQFGHLYSQYYDLLYSDKNYNEEVLYIHNILHSNGKDINTVLDMGCGTGKHAELLCDLGYTVHGIDRSADMLKIAETRRMGKEDNLSFNLEDIQTLSLGKKFDAVVSLFHVISYQNSNKELIQAMKVAKEHLSENGIFIFDFWYGPAVLTDLPVTKVKRLSSDAIKVTRIAEPTLHPQNNIVDVHYDIFIEDIKTQNIIERTELHSMRYFFDQELQILCDQLGFSIEKKFEWLSNKTPDFNSWNVVWVLRS